MIVNPLSANPTKWSNTLKQFRRQIADELFECVSLFCGIGANRINYIHNHAITSTYSNKFTVDWEHVFTNGVWKIPVKS